MLTFHLHLQSSSTFERINNHIEWGRYLLMLYLGGRLLEVHFTAIIGCVTKRYLWVMRDRRCGLLLGVFSILKYYDEKETQRSGSKLIAYLINCSTTTTTLIWPKELFIANIWKSTNRECLLRCLRHIGGIEGCFNISLKKTKTKIESYFLYLGF